MVMPAATMTTMTMSLAAVKKFWTMLARRTLAQFTSVMSTEQERNITSLYSTCVFL